MDGSYSIVKTFYDVTRGNYYAPNLGASSRTAKTFFIPDSKGKCPDESSPNETFRGNPACGVYCATETNDKDILSCDPKNTDPDKGLVYSLSNGNFRYNGTYVTSDGFHLNNGDACYSWDSGDDFLKVPGPNESCCTLKEGYDGEPNCNPNPDTYWKKPTTANDPYMYSCQKGECVTDYSGKYRENTCRGDCATPTQLYKCVKGECVKAAVGVTLEQCQKKCATPPIKLRFFKCVNGKCVESEDGTMGYSECMKQCRKAKTSSNLPLILGVSGGIILLILLIVFIYFFVIEKKKRRSF